MSTGILDDALPITVTGGCGKNVCVGKSGVPCGHVQCEMLRRQMETWVRSVVQASN